MKSLSQHINESIVNENKRSVDALHAYISNSDYDDNHRFAKNILLKNIDKIYDYLDKNGYRPTTDDTDAFVRFVKSIDSKLSEIDADECMTYWYNAGK